MTKSRAILLGVLVGVVVGIWGGRDLFPVVAAGSTDALARLVGRLLGSAFICGLIGWAIGAWRSRSSQNPLKRRGF